MRVVYMGTPDFAVPALEALCDGGYEVTLVVTTPDKPVGRKQILTPSAVKTAALGRGLPVYQPKTLKTDEAYERIRAEAPDFIVVAAYGKILPQRVLDIPRYGAINIHGSLLPKYRGAAPIQRSVIDGEAQTGLTIMRMDAGLDTGDILRPLVYPIGENETAGEVFDALAALSGKLLTETLPDVAAGRIVPVKQDDSLSTYASMLTKDEAVIDWTRPAQAIHDKIRGMDPWPVAVTTMRGKRVKLRQSRMTDQRSGKAPGTLIAENGRLYCVCGDGRLLELTQIQPEGAKNMESKAFLAGHDPDGIILGRDD